MKQHSCFTVGIPLPIRGKPDEDETHKTLMPTNTWLQAEIFRHISAGVASTGNCQAESLLVTFEEGTRDRGVVRVRENAGECTKLVAELCRVIQVPIPPHSQALFYKVLGTYPVLQCLFSLNNRSKVWNIMADLASNCALG